MPDEPTFVVPRTIPDALSALSVDGAMAIGGGTSVALLLKNRLVEPTSLVYLGHVDGLSGIALNASGDLVIGAMTTLREIVLSETIRAAEPILATTADRVGNPRVRAVATIGGALAHSDARQDLPPVLLALDARVHVIGPSGERDLPLDTFFHGLMDTELAEDELITEVLVPLVAGRVVEYSRFTPASEDDFPTVGVAASVRFDPDRRVVGARIALGGVAPAVILAANAAASIIGTALGEADIASAARAAADATDPSDDLRGSAGYKRAMTEVWTRRTLEACARRA